MPGMEPLPRPPYLDQASPKAALISFHADQARYNRQQITEQMLFDLEHLRNSDQPFLNPEEWMARMETLDWNDGSIVAVWRDRMRFHERCVEFLTNGR